MRAPSPASPCLAPGRSGCGQVDGWRLLEHVEVLNDALRAVVVLSPASGRHQCPAPLPQGPVEGLCARVASQSEIVAQYGCPFGSLCSELDKRAEGPSFATAELLQVPIQWAEEQFRAIGRRDARSLALDLLAAYEGSALLTNTLADPSVLVMTERRLDHWIDSL